jgi:hypothetical protein
MVDTPQHPALLLPAYRRMIAVLLALAALDALWSFGFFYCSLRPPLWLAAYVDTPFVPGVLYSWYACMHSFYIALCVGLGHFLVSRGWLRAAAFAAAIPGPGFLLSLPQMIPAFWIFHTMGREAWQKFFEWRHRSNPVNDLTKKGRGKLLPF